MIFFVTFAYLKIRKISGFDQFNGLKARTGHGSQDMDTDMDRRTWIAGQGLQDMDTDMNCRTLIWTWIAGHGHGHGYRIQKVRNSKVVYPV